MTVYANQRDFFRQAYAAGEHPWPAHEPSRFVRAFLRREGRRDWRRAVNGGGADSRRPAGRVLDIGCGEGRHTYLFAQAGFHAVGLDAEPLAIRRAHRLRPRPRPRSRQTGQTGRTGRAVFLVGDALMPPFQSQTFDVLIDYGCLHHVRKQDGLAYRQALIRLLRDGGYFLLSCFSTRFRHHADERRTRDWLVHRGHYDRFFRRRNFQALFGPWFKILRIEEERHGLQAFYHVLMLKRPPGTRT